MTTAERIEAIEQHLLLNGIIGKEQSLICESVAKNLEPFYPIMESHPAQFDTLARGMRNCWLDGVFANTLEED